MLYTFFRGILLVLTTALFRCIPIERHIDPAVQSIILKIY
jgi:hypothetical protein